MAQAFAREPLGYARSGAGRLRNVLFSTGVWEDGLAPQSPKALRRLSAAISSILFVVVYGGAAIGIVLAKDRGAALLLGVWIVLHMLIVLFSPAMESRHRTPFEPALWTLAASAIAVVLPWRRRP